MVDIRVAVESTWDKAVSYIVYLKKAFHYEKPETDREFDTILKDLEAHRLDPASAIAKAEQLFKDDEELLLRLKSFFYANYDETIVPSEQSPLEGNKAVVEESVPVMPTRDVAVSYASDVKKAFQNDKPETLREFINILDDLEAHRLDPASAIAKGEELFKDHEQLLLGLRSFYANIGFGLSQTVVEESVNVPVVPTRDDAVSFISSVKKAFQDEKPETLWEFINILHALKANRVERDSFIEANRVERASFIAKAEELFKDHPNLLLGLKSFFANSSETIVPSEQCRTVPLEANKGFDLLQTVIEESIPVVPTYKDALSYVSALKKAFHDKKPETLREFTNILHDFKAHRLDKASVIARAKELFKDHPNLLLGLRFLANSETTIPPEANKGFGLSQTVVEKSVSLEPTYDDEEIIPLEARTTIHPEAEHLSSESINEEKKPTVDDFIKKLQRRFRTVDTHLAESIPKIMKAHEEGMMSASKMQEEVIALLCYHEDLIKEFSKLIPKVLWHQGLSKYY